MAAKKLSRKINDYLWKQVQHAERLMKKLAKQKNVKALERLGADLYNMRDVVDGYVSRFEELSSDAENRANDIEDDEDDRHDE